MSSPRVTRLPTPRPDPFAVVVRVLIYIFLGLLVALALGYPKAPVWWPPYNAAADVDR